MMFWKTKTVTPAPMECAPCDLQRAMDEVCAFGMPHILQLPDGSWFCGVKRTGDHVAVEVKSTFKEESMLQAINACVEKIRNLKTATYKPTPQEEPK